MPAQFVEKLHQRPRSFRKLKAINPLILRGRRMPAHHMADVQFGHFVVTQVQRFVTRDS